MYAPLDIDGENYRLRPMNCPHHHLIYGAMRHSYRELPLRIAEYGQDYRYEASGGLSGLMRVRGFCMNDAHIYCRYDQAKDEFIRVMKLHARYYDLLNIKEYYMRLSLPDLDKLDKYVDEPEKWLEALAIIRQAMAESGLHYVEGKGEAAFYGPKIDFMIKSAIGTEYTISTNQLDFLATETFDLKYIGEDGADHPVYVIHRAPLGTHERFTAFLIEHYAGAFPTWLAPVQARVIPISRQGGRLRPKGAGHAVQHPGGQWNRRPPGRHRHLQRADAEKDPRRPVAENPLYAGGGRARGGRGQGRGPRALRQGSGRHAARNFRRQDQIRGRIPCGCGRIGLRGAPRRASGLERRIRAKQGRPFRVRRKQYRARHRKAPVCVHDRTSFRLAPTDQRSAVMAHGLQQERVIVPRRPQQNDRAPTKDGPRINEDITAKTIFLIGDDSHKYGEIGLDEALALAEEKGLDVVEISPDKTPPVCKLMDYGKYKYEQQKKANEARKKQKIIEIKEIKMRPTIDDHDYDVKMKAMKRFFDEGDKVKVTLALPRPRNGPPASGHGPAHPRPERHRNLRQA